VVSAAIVAAVSPVATMGTIAVSLIGGRHPLAPMVEGSPEHVQWPPGWMRVLDRLTPVKAFAVGAVLLQVSPADLLVYLSAIQGISGADLSNGQRNLINVALIAAVDICIIGPLGIFVAMGPARR
jgi:hypothetical protein